MLGLKYLSFSSSDVFQKHNSRGKGSPITTWRDNKAADSTETSLSRGSNSSAYNNLLLPANIFSFLMPFLNRTGVLFYLMHHLQFQF